MARPMNINKRIDALEQMARRSRKNAVKARRMATELLRFDRGKRAANAAQRALRLAEHLDQAAKAA